MASRSRSTAVRRFWVKSRVSKWSPTQLPRLDGKIALVTGANSGLGLETAKTLAGLGAELVITCRGADKANTAIRLIRDALPDAGLSALDMDLGNLASVQSAAKAFLAAHSSLDILVNNAGVMGLPRSRTDDGFEKVFGVNHLGHFALTGHLMPALDAAAAARVITVTSVTSRKGRLPMDDLNWERRRYDKAAAYAQAKLANLSFALELEKRLRKAGKNAISLAVHPGYAATNVVFARDAQMTLGRRIWVPMASLGNKLIAQPAERGAWPTLYAAAMPDVEGGQYFGPDGLLEFRGYPVPVFINPLAIECGAELWNASEQMTGVRYL